MKFGVVVFPGSNCDDDMMHVLGTVMGADVKKYWHKETSLAGLSSADCVILPGGFSYGDYLRSGAIARFSPIMQSVVEFANAGGLVFGICNGFQILCEAHLLPGVLLRNRDQKFIAKTVHLKTITADSPVSRNLSEGEVLSMPIAHAEGRFHINEEGLNTLEKNNQVIFRYCEPDGTVSAESNINGSVNNIAGICNVNRNVIGMMPHPERASELILGNNGGKKLFDSLINWSKSDHNVESIALER